MFESNPESISARINAGMRQSRDINELIGLCKGVLADGVVNFAEAVFMLEWLEAHTDCLNIWPASELYATLDSFLEDGVLDSSEESQLLGTLVGITGVPVRLEREGGEAVSTSSTLPLYEPEGAIDFMGRNFVLTGKFEFGPRGDCERLVIDLGGVAQKAPTKATNYLVVGNIGSRDWAHSSFGRKIQKAAEMRRNGIDLYIISESKLVSCFI